MPNLQFLEITGVAVRDTVWKPKISNARGQYLQVGEAKGFNAFSAIKFDPDRVLPDSFRVDTMKLVLKRFPDRTIYPQEGAIPLTIELREITEKWGEDSLFAGSLVNRLTYPIVIDQVTVPVAREDTAVSITIPDTLWRRWLSDDTTTFGLAIMPSSDGSLVAFNSSESGTGFSSVLQIVGREYSFVDSSQLWMDTALFREQVPLEDAFLATDTEPTTSGRLYLSQGMAQRAAIYFPIDSISEVYSRIINRAELFLYADTLNSSNLLYHSTNLLYRDGALRDTAWFSTPDSAHLDLLAIEATSFDSTNTVLKFVVSGTVSAWIGKRISNGGFQVQSSTESEYLARQVFYSTNAEDSTKRPKLRIWYTEE